ncbi:hypothetical protein JXQ31_06370 [candidate division KSB1 bacterium]|nr:hypothetical protein [candidate division KSB1 bacterium]
MLFLFVLGSGVVFAQTRGILGAISLFDRDLVIQGEDRKGPYFLPDSLIIQNSEVLFLDDIPVPKIAYDLNYINGEIRFRDSVPKKSRIRILYKIIPRPLKKQYYHRVIKRQVFDAPTGPADGYKITAGTNKEEDFAANLSKSGSITRGVTVGSNRGLKVNSSLNINVSGKVAENVEVIAALTDQTTPIQPEGTTQNLQEIDKVFVQIKAPNLSATMGDFQLNYSGTQFARYSRKLQGAMGNAQSDNFALTVSGAVSRGKYISMSFTGQEGYQGPYQLKGDRGQIDIIVLAGTERVYIDGEQMVRGETNDYIIDYASAQVTFTRSRLITSDSRIVVDFQYSDEKFRRNLYSAQGKAQFWDGKIQLGTTFLREADDGNNPLDFTLSDERLAVLRAAGDDPDMAVVSGETYVGPGKGRYTKDEKGIYTYAGADSGDYQVSFSDMGQDMGSYKYKGSGIFEYVGENMGRYAPVILLPTAKSHNLLDFDVQASPLAFISLRGEVAFSGLDNNTYSSVDDEDNQGTAQNWTVKLKPGSMKLLGVNWGRIELGGNYRRIDDRFQDIDRTTEIEYNRRWDLPQAAQRGEETKEIQADYAPFTGFLAGGEFGSISKGDYFKSDRWQFHNSLSRNRLPDYTLRIERIKKNNLAQRQNGDWWRGNGSASYKIWKIRPFVKYEGEVKKENWSDSLNTGFKFDDRTGGLEFTPFSRISATAKFSQREDSDYLGYDRFEKTSLAKTQNYQLKIQNIKSFTAGMEFTHREKSFTDPSVSNKLTDLADFRMQFSPWKRAVNANLNYQISNTATVKKERVYIKVSEGDGNYRFDEQLNEYVNDPLGDHILRIITTDEFLPVVELKTSTRLRLEPKRLWNRRATTQKQKTPLWQRAAEIFSSESYIAIEEKSQDKKVWDIYLMKMSTFQQPGTTIFGNIQFRQDLFLFENNRDFSLRLRYKTMDEKNNQFLEGGQDRTEKERSARITARISNKLSTQSELISSRTGRTFDYRGRQNRDIHGNQLKTDLSYRPKAPLELALEGRFSLEEDRFYEDPTRLTALALVPRVNYSLRQKGRLRAELEWSHVKAEPEGRLIPYEMAGGRSLGNSMRWDIRFDYRVSQTIRATFSYSGRNEPERNRTIHTGRAEVTAAFR